MWHSNTDIRQKYTLRKKVIREKWGILQTNAIKSIRAGDHSPLWTITYGVK